MKKIINLLFTLIVLICQSKAQTLSPDQNQEYCPNTNYNFVISVAGTITSITPTGGCVLISRNANTFVGRFNDVNIKQTFTVYYTDNNGISQNIPFDFKKIKSLFYSDQVCGYIQPNLTTITAPSCQVNTIPISFSNLQWNTAFESPTFCFGSITFYEYQIPVGWKIGTTTCINNNQWIAGSNSISIITDANSGDGGYVQIRPTNSGCGTGLQPGYSQTVSIAIKRNPIFTINPSSFQVPCGTSTTKTVAVNLSVPPGCTVTYNWTLSNPYTYTYPTGGIVPQTFTTTIPTFTFVTPTFSGVLPSISVTPIFNGVSQPTLICSASRTPIAPSQYPGFAIVGGNIICPSATYSAINVPAGFTLHWYTSTYPYGATIALINNPTANTINVTSNGSGVISLIAELTNPCGQTVSITKPNISVGGGLPPTAINGYFTNYLGQMEGIHTNYYGCTQCVNYIQTGAWTTAYITGLSNTTWSVVQANGSWIPFNSSTGTPSLQLQIPLSNTTAIYRLTNTTSCGAQTFDFLFFAKDRPFPFAANQTKIYRLYPNPAKDIITIEHLAKTEQTVLNDAEPTSKFENNNTVATKSILETSIKSIEIIDLMGITRFKKICSTDKLNVITIPVDKLSNGIYLMKIFDGKESKIEKFIVQH